MKYFTGIDVSLRFVSICVIDEAGIVQYEKKVAAEVDPLRTDHRQPGFNVTEASTGVG